MGTNSPVVDATLSHVIYNVLGMPQDGPFDKAIRTHSAWTITHLLCIPDDTLMACITLMMMAMKHHYQVH